jgi:hypothetical protein
MKTFDDFLIDCEKHNVFNDVSPKEMFIEIYNKDPQIHSLVNYYRSMTIQQPFSEREERIFFVCFGVLLWKLSALDYKCK